MRDIHQQRTSVGIGRESGEAGSIRSRPLAFSVAEASEVSGLGRTTLYALMNSGRLASTKVGKRRLIPCRELEILVGVDG